MITRKKFNKILINLEKISATINIEIGNEFLKLDLFNVWDNAERDAHKTITKSIEITETITNYYHIFCKERIKNIKIIMEKYLI